MISESESILPAQSLLVELGRWKLLDDSSSDDLILRQDKTFPLVPLHLAMDISSGTP